MFQLNSTSSVVADDDRAAIMRSNKKNDGKNKGILAALLPGAKINSTGKVTVAVGTTKETVIFNVGGTKFETYRSTLYGQPDLPFADENFMRKYFRKDQGDFFFDRDPDMFKSILNYLRYGELHLPSNICGPAAKAELEFWNIPDDVIERCCWTDYNSWNSTVAALNQLEKDRKGSLLEQEEVQPGEQTFWKKWRPRCWKLLNDPDSSRSAKIYGWISLVFVTLSIFSFMAETHPSFKYTIYRNMSSNVTTTRSTEYADVTTNTSSVNISTPTEKDEGVLVTHPALGIIDIVCLIFFSVEFVTRLILASQKLKYLSSLMGVIDLLALIPDYIEIIVYSSVPDLQNDGAVDVISILRITRVLRIFRLIRHVPGLWILIYTLRASFKELLLMSAFLIVGMLVFASLIYFADDQATFTSIPHGFWWALITMTTVGYGDMFPTTNWGYVVGSFTALSGLLMIGFSVPVLVNNFIMYYKHIQFAIEEEENKKARQKREKKHHPEGGLLHMMTKNGTKNKETSPEEVPLKSISSNGNSQEENAARVV